MLSSDHIHQLATKHQTTELNILREYFQHLFLSYLYQHPETNSILFKGGTALRIIHHSPRFSEDLDFSAPKLSTHHIEQALQKTLIDLQKENVNPQLEEAKTTSGGYLAAISFASPIGTIRVLVEISKRQRNSAEQAVTIVNDFIPPYTLIGLASDQLVAEKITALQTRQKPRDFFDLYFILRANLLSPKQKHILHQIVPLLEKSHLNFETELKQFLPKSHWPIIRNFPTTLKQEINQFI